MVVRYQSAILLVEDVQRSYGFYRDLLGQEVLVANGPMVRFHGGLTIRQVDGAYQTIFCRLLKVSSQTIAKNSLLYFETNELEPLWNRLSGEMIRPVHAICRQRTGQYVFRVYDPDGYIVEIGETLPVVVPHLVAEGMRGDEMPGLKFASTDSSDRLEELMALLDMCG